MSTGSRELQPLRAQAHEPIILLTTLPARQGLGVGCRTAAAGSIERMFLGAPGGAGAETTKSQVATGLIRGDGMTTKTKWLIGIAGVAAAGVAVAALGWFALDAVPVANLHLPKYSLEQTDSAHRW